MINVFIVGSKGIPARYGGFETFADNLVKRKVNPEIKYFVSCMGNQGVFEYNGATCFSIPLKKDNAFSRITNVSKALEWVENYLELHPGEEKSIVYILGCRVGLFISKHRKKFRNLGCLIVTNPDGLEWKRDKWSWWQKQILLFSEQKLIKNSDYVVCDSLGIKDYVGKRYPFILSNTHYIAYGSDIHKSTCSEMDLDKWLEQYGTTANEYYLIIGRFVPENNYELIIREFMKSSTKKKLLIITNVEKNAFYNKLIRELRFEQDNRIVFAGTLYDEQLIKKVRENAFCYIHGHSVGGTNPSLLESLASTRVNLLFDVIFNKEVGEDQCLYFSGLEGDLSNQISRIDTDYQKLSRRLNCRAIIERRYAWRDIVIQYEKFFMDCVFHCRDEQNKRES